jgi:hypothetical protein
MPLSLSLFPDIDGLDGLISDSEVVLAVFLATLAILLAFVVIGRCVDYVRRQSPVEKIVRRRPF